MSPALSPYLPGMFVPVSVDEFEFVDVDSSNFHELMEVYLGCLISADSIFVGVPSPSGQVVWLPISEADVRACLDRLALFRVSFHLDSNLVLWIG